MNDGDPVHELALLLAQHQRLDPPGGRCTCGHETALGDLTSRHVAEHVLRSNLIVPADLYAEVLHIKRVAHSVEEWNALILYMRSERDRLATTVDRVRALCDKYERNQRSDFQRIPVTELRAALEGDRHV